MSENKKSKFGKVWILVCILAVVLGLLLTFIGPISAGMSEYNNHEHGEWCMVGNWDNSEFYPACCYTDYNNAFEFAMDDYQGGMWAVIFVVGCLAVANVVMVIIYAARKSKKKNPVEAIAPAAIAVPSPSAEEQVILERGMFFNWFRITVTNKRVMYKGIFWRRMNLPLNRITATSTGIFCYLSVGSSAGRIHMIFFRHYREVYDTINTLLNGLE